MKKKFFYLLFLCIIYASCVSLNLNNMAPNIEKITTKCTNKSLSINRIYGGQELDIISKETYLKAFINTLSSSGIFSKINADESSDYSLRAIIISQDLFQYLFRMEFTLCVKYQLFDCDRNLIWENIITSKYGRGFSIGLIWLKLKEIAEQSAKDNLIQLIKYLSNLNL